LGDGWFKLPPVVIVLKRVMQQACGLSPGARLLALVIADHLGWDEGDRLVTFVGNDRLVRETGLSLRTVRNKVNELRRARPPLFQIQHGGHVRDIPTKCNVFTLVRYPVALEASWESARKTMTHVAVPNRHRARQLSSTDPSSGEGEGQEEVR